MAILEINLGAQTAELAARASRSVVQVRGRGPGQGSGVVWGDGASVLTNYHVVAGIGESLRLLAHDDQVYQATLVAGNPRLDLALLRVAGGGLEPAPLGDSARLRVGELVFAIGSPWGQRGVVTAGIVSGLGEIPAGRGERPASYIRSDVRLAPGNSGGPLLDAGGAVVGINAMIFGGDLAVAIPSHVAAAWAGSLSRRPAHLGVGVQSAQISLGEGGLRPALLVAQLAQGGPAARAGLLIGDLLLSLDGQELRDSDSLIAALSARGPGATVRLSILRGGAPAEVDITLGAPAG